MELIDQVSKGNSVRYVSFNFNHFGHSLDDIFEVMAIVFRYFEVGDELGQESELHSLGTSLRNFFDTGVVFGGIADIDRRLFIVVNVIGIVMHFSLRCCKDLEDFPQLSIHQAVFIYSHQNTFCLK